MVDPIFAAVELNARHRLSAGYYLGLSLPMYASWLLVSVIGAVFGEAFGNTRVIGLDFVFTAYFGYMIMGFRGRPNAFQILLASAAASLAAYLLIGPRLAYRDRGSRRHCNRGDPGGCSASRAGHVMSDAVQTYGLIIALGLVTYATRIGGHLVLSAIRNAQPARRGGARCHSCCGDDGAVDTDCACHRDCVKPPG